MLTTSDQSDEELSIRNGEAGDSDWDSTAGSDSNMPRKPILKLTNLKVKVREARRWVGRCRGYLTRLILLQKGAALQWNNLASHILYVVRQLQKTIENSLLSRSVIT